MVEQDRIFFTNDDGQKIPFFVVEQTMIAGTEYLLVTEEDEDETQAYIMKSILNDEEGEMVCEFVEDEKELDAISRVFAELLEDISIEVQE